MDDEQSTIEHFYRVSDCEYSGSTLSELAMKLMDGTLLLRFLKNADPSNIWSIFPLEGANFHGAFVFVRFCISTGIRPDVVPDPWDIIGGINTDRVVVCLSLMFSRSLSSVIHSGPKADDLSAECSCLLCRWKSAIRILSPLTRGWSPSRLPNSIRRLIEEGVPSVVREHVWLLLSGGLNLLRTRQSHYISHFPRALEANKYLPLIDLDISRTFTDELSWRTRGFHLMTRRILAAYSFRNNSVGYCQGLSYIAGTLVTVTNEESAFAILCALLEDGLMPPDYYTSLTGAVVDRQVLEALVPQFLPDLVHLLNSNLSDYTFMAIPWHMCLFSTTLDRSCSVRLWDFLFSLGPCVLFRTSLGILSELQSALLVSGLEIQHVRNALTRIEHRTVPSDIAMYCQTFAACTNELVDQIREQHRLTSEKCFMTVRVVGSSDSVTDEVHFGQQNPTHNDSMERTLRDRQNSAFSGLGDFMGQL